MPFTPGRRRFRPRGEHPTRKRLIEVTVAFLATNSTDEIYLDDIVAEAGVTKGALYYHFQDFPELLETALVERLRRIVDLDLSVMQEALTGCGTTEELFLRIHQLAKSTREAQWRSILVERARALALAGRRSEALRQGLAFEQRRLTEGYSSFLLSLAERGLIRQGLDTQVLALLLQSYFMGRLVDDISEQQIGEDRWVSTIDDLFERFLRP